MIGLLGALPVCPMALLVFIDFFTELKALVRSARSRLRGGSRRSPGLSSWQPPLAPISRRCLPARDRALGHPDIAFAGCEAGKSYIRVARRALQGRQPSQGTLGRSQAARGGFSPTPWLAPRTGGRMAPGASRGRPKGAMKTSRPVDARLWAAREDPGLQSELGGEYTRPYGGCHEHAARFVLL